MVEGRSEVGSRDDAPPLRAAQVKALRIVGIHHGELSLGTVAGRTVTTDALRKRRYVKFKRSRDRSTLKFTHIIMMYGEVVGRDLTWGCPGTLSISSVHLDLMHSVLPWTMVGLSRFGDFRVCRSLEQISRQSFKHQTLY